MTEYKEEEYLLISGIQHFVFCQRQWALIHIEEQWYENYLTATGRVLHNKAHDEFKTEKRKGLITLRALKVSSSRLGISGECDVVEFYEDKNGVPLHNYSGLFLPYPVEYKRGKPKIDDCDRLQLCAQATCLEEMLGCSINSGALYYGEPRRRETVIFNAEIREKLLSVINDMHKLYRNQYTPKGKIDKKCKSCSLKEACLTMLSKNHKTVKQYYEDSLSEV